MDNRPRPVRRAEVQYGRDALGRMTPQEIVKAQKEGKLVDLMSGKAK